MENGKWKRKKRPRSALAVTVILTAKLIDQVRNLKILLTASFKDLGYGMNKALSKAPFKGANFAAYSVLPKVFRRRAEYLFHENDFE